MLNLRQSQKQTLKISPSQIQLLNFLQLNSLELEQYIKNELEENPILEEGADSSNDDNDFDDDYGYGSEGNDRTQDYMDWDEFGNDDTPDYKTRVNNFSDDSETYTPTVVEMTDWRTDVKEQLHLFLKTERQKNLADFVVDSLTDEGYLLNSAESIADDVSFTSGMFIEEEEVEEIINLLKKLEPAGLGAKNVQECLLRQLDRQLGADIARIIVKDYFEELGSRNYEKLMRVCELTPDELKAEIALIGSLNPHPIVGGQSASSISLKDNIVPDYIVNIEDETIEVSLNSRGIPPLRINKTYSEELGSSKAVNSYLNTKISAANWLIEAIQQRENTMLKTMRVIVGLQRQYFLTGDVRTLKPMILKDVADKIGMDISTVSRVTSGKYAQTPFGIIHLKELFTEGLLNEKGEEVSNRQIQVALSDIINQENKQVPYNDTELTELLAEKGFPIARRTVAKYREILDIPSAQMRRIL